MNIRQLLIGTVLAITGAATQAQSGAQVGGSGQAQAGVSASQGSVAASGNGSAGGNAEASGAQATLDAGQEIDVVLQQPLDSSRNKPGDRVTGTVMRDVKQDGKVVLKKGTTVVGRVTTAQPRAQGSGEGAARSQLGVVFDKALPKEGGEVPLAATIQAVAAASAGSMQDNAMPSAPMAGQSRGGLAGGVTGTAGAALGGVAGSATGAVGGATRLGTRSAGAVGGLTSAGRLAGGSRGVFGMPNVELASAAAGSANGSVLSSPGRQVRLDKGTQLLLVAQGAANAGADTGRAASTAPAAANGLSGSAASTASGAGRVTSGAGSASGTVSGAASGAAGVQRAAPTQGVEKEPVNQK